MAMTLEQLRVFVAVAEREHVTKTALAINMTQSAISAAIAALESHYRTRLFDRVGRRIELTEAGRIFLGEARAVLARAASAESMLADLAGLKRGTVRLAASQTVANYWLPPRMAKFLDQYPEIRLPLAIGNTEQVARAIEAGNADLGFIEGNIDNAMLSIEKIDDDRLILVVPPNHPWAGTPPADWSELAATRWVLREAGSGTRSMFEAALHSHNIRSSAFDIALELPSNEAIISAVSAGAGATVISGLAAAPALHADTIRQVKFSLPARQFFLLHHIERNIGVATAAFRRSVMPA
jgi:DNA-binding transcriptional LysR family regulator